MAASVTATSVLPVPPKPEPRVITPDLSDGSRIAVIVCRRHSATASRLMRSRLPGGTISRCLSTLRDTAPRTPSCAGAGGLFAGEGACQAARSLPGKPDHHAPISSGYWDIAPLQRRATCPRDYLSATKLAHPAGRPTTLSGRIMPAQLGLDRWREPEPASGLYIGCRCAQRCAAEFGECGMRVRG